MKIQHGSLASKYPTEWICKTNNDLGDNMQWFLRRGTSSHVPQLPQRDDPIIVGKHSNFKKIPTYTQDHGGDIATRGESVVHVPS